MKTLDIILLVVFVIALIVLFILPGCGLDLYFFIAGLVVAALCALRMFLQREKKAEDAQ